MSFVYNAHALALGARNGIGLHEADVGADGEHALQFVGQALAQLEHGAELVAEIVLAHLDLHLKRIEAVDTVDDQHVYRFELGHFEDYALHLRGENVDTADNKHVVAAADDAGHADVGSAAGARLADERREVLGSVTQQGHACFGERGEDQLSGRPAGQGLQGLGVDDLGIEVVLRDV